MRPLTLASLLALAAAAVAASTAAASPALRFKVDSCAEASHACHAISPAYATFDKCEAARGHMMTQRGHMNVCVGPGHPLPAGDHQG